MKKYVLLIVLIIFTLMGCSSSNNNDDISNIEKVKDELKNMFETNGYTFSSENAIRNILEGERINVTLNDTEDLQVFIYDSVENATLDSKRIGFDGFSYTTDKMSSEIDWVDSPIFINIII